MNIVGTTRAQRINLSKRKHILDTGEFIAMKRLNGSENILIPLPKNMI